MKDEHPGAERPKTPRWVKVSGLVVVVLVAATIVLLLVQGGHEPSRHTSSGGDPRSASSL